MKQDVPQMPERLRECFVEDWVSAGEEMPQWAVDGEEPWEFWATVAANRRWSRALNEWMVKHGIPREERSRLVPLHRPRWRNPQLESGN